MSEKQVDVLAAMDRLLGNTRTMAGLSGDPHMREALREGEKARAAVAELIDMARIADEVLSKHGISLARGDGLTLAAAIASAQGGSADA